MSEHGIEDEQLPDDLAPGEDNPLAEGLEDAETAGDLAPGELLQEGKKADEMDEDSTDSADDTAERSGDDGASGEV